MRVEVPEFKRCCFCVPLRYGLLVWSYLLLIPITLFVARSVYFYATFDFTSHEHNNKIWIYVAEWIVYDLIKLANIFFSIILIVGAHKKSPRLLRVYCKGGLIVAVLFFVVQVISIVIIIVLYSFSHLWMWKILAFLLVLALVFLGMQVYIVFLARSEISKLEHTNSYQFSNMAATAEAAYYQPEDIQTTQ